ncbi:transcription antitermination factor NusB [Clostridium sp. MSJ-8]|uniref:transcription antitermination factor NusB n=1 Tax=Clostridium sp. MSJ-8 TaxID=2841510 RepID=UPI001C0F248C|nr:transcription antitermination factor NusB [Clostridium sp. MSJ-8]
MSRKESRQKAMEILFSMELTKDNPQEALENYLDNYEGNKEILDIKYIQDILEGVYANKTSIDELISANLIKWKIERISKVNLCILRLAIFEAKNLDDVPAKVALNEALEICKIYSDEKSVSFINGVLDKILKQK